MAGFLGRIFGGAPAPAPMPSELSSTFDDSSTRDNSREANRRELLHSVVRDAMRRHAIPSSWIETKVFSAPPGVHLLLIVREEPQRMYYFIRNFEESVATDLRRFDPKSSDWLGGISWQFPAKDMPSGKRSNVQAPASAVQPAPAAVAAPAVATVAEVAAPAHGGDDKAAALADLERLFAIRDEELRRGGSNGDHPEFAPTQPAFAPTEAGFSPSGAPDFAPTEVGDVPVGAGKR